MGTRRSRHNKGVKPLYKEHNEAQALAIKAAEIAAFSAYVSTHFPDGPKCPACGSSDHYLLKTRNKFKCADCYKQYAATDNSPFKSHKLPFTKINEIERMKPCSPTDLMNKLDLSYKAAWSLKQRLGEQWPAWKVIIQQVNAALLAYPYVVTRRSSSDDILAVNALVPRSLPSELRGDVCQDIMLALLEGSTTLPALKADRALVRAFVRRAMGENLEQSGHAAPLYDEAHTDETFARAAKDWRWEAENEVRRYADTYRAFIPPSQIEEVFASEVKVEQGRRHALGEHWSLEDAVDAMS